MDILLGILIIIYCGLLFELIMGWSPKQKNKFYIKLFDIKTYLLTLLIAVILLSKPVIDLIQIREFTYPILAIPFFYLLFFQLINRVSLLINKRNIIIVGRGDNWPTPHKWYVDSLLHYVATILSVALPLLISLYFDGKLNFH